MHWGLCLSAGMTSASIWISRRSWRPLDNCSKEVDSTSGNSSLGQVFFSHSMRPKHSTWINSEVSSRYSLSYLFSPIYSRKRGKNHFLPSLFFSQRSIMLSRWRYSSRQKIWNSILHSCFLVSVPSESSLHCGRVNPKIHRSSML